MKGFGILAVTLLTATSPLVVQMSNAQQSERPVTQVCTLKITGMTCAGCEAAVRMAARKVDGVTEVKVSYAKGNAEVTYDPAKTTPDAIAKVVTDKSGFRAEVVKLAAKP